MLGERNREDNRHVERDSDNLTFETPDIKEIERHLADQVASLFGEFCNLAEPEPSDWNQPLSADARHLIQIGSLEQPPQPSRPICVLSRVSGRHWLNVWRALSGSGEPTGMSAQKAIEETVRRLRAAQVQEVERRERERLPTSTLGDTWIRVGFRMQRSSAASSRLVLSVCEVYIFK